MIDIEPLRDYLAELGIVAGEVSAEPIGEGHSNLTYLLRAGDRRLVLRRPPLGPLAPSANDVVREARILTALRGTGIPVPEVLAICEQGTVIGAPFYLMPFVEGEVLSDRLPQGFDADAAPALLAEELVRTLAELHAVDVESAGLSFFGKSSGYLERQVKRFGLLLEHNATRPLPDLEQVGEWLADNLPHSRESTFVHGDYRLGNAMFAPPGRIVAVLDWEMATTGDPLADLGYFTAMWADPDDAPNPMLDLSSVTRLPGFPRRDELARRYAEASGRSIEALPWYRVLAIWKAAIFLEGSYGRFISGASDDAYFGRLGEGVPLLGRLARERAAI